MLNSPTVTFQLKRSKQNSEGLCPLYLRVTMNHERFELSVSRNVNPSLWKSERQKMLGNSEEARSINAYLKKVEHKVYDAYELILSKKDKVHIDDIRDVLLGRTEASRKKFIVAVFQEHNNQVTALVGKEFTASTLERYKTSLKHTQEFIKWKYKVNDMAIDEINHEFIMAYDFYLRTERNCNNNSTVKYLKNFKKIILSCIANGWLDKDPFAKYKPKVKEVKRDYLSMEEVEAIAAKRFPSERLSVIRDIFLFSCFTGLAYADVQKLKRSELFTWPDGSVWIHTNRQKTGTDSRIPLLSRAKELVDKYAEHPHCLAKDTILPVPSNQKMNSYLKEIATVCGINKELTFHIARHTFATSVTLANGVSIESVSKMLGHKHIRTTQHYAKILDVKVGSDMKQLEARLNE